MTLQHQWCTTKNFRKVITVTNADNIAMMSLNSKHGFEVTLSLNATREIIDFLSKKIKHANKLGIKNIIIDPGFGFGKSESHNYELLKNLGDFKKFNYPILVGLSRKSMIYKKLNTSPEFALNGTTAVHAWALERGAKILRVHDVKEAKECVTLWKSLQ